MTPAEIDEAIATAKPVAEAMLPSSSTPREKTLLTAEIARLALFKPEIIRTIWDPWRCPAAWLPWLAWALSVDIWDNNWSEIEKRREIAASPMIHRLKGTRWAVEAALERLGAEFDLTEWWEPAPARRRGTFRVFIDVASSTTDTLSLREEATARVRASKPQSRFAEIQLGIRETGPLGIAAATVTRSTIIAEPFVVAGPAEETGPLGIAAAVATQTTLTFEPRPQ